MHMTGRVYKSTGSWYVVKTTDGKIWKARIKGIFKIDGITSTNPIAVGDEVELELYPKEEGIAIITAINKRKNYIARTSPHQNKQQHIVASNLDQAMLVCTLKEPKTSQGFIDRFLVTTEAYHITTIIVFNKTDIYNTKELKLLESLYELYSNIGYTVFNTSVKKVENLDQIENILKAKTTLLSGHSGVGKSSIINYLFPNLKLRTQEVSDWSGKGMHTTTFAEMFDLPNSGSIIDTPGIKEFGLVNIDSQELSHYFVEMKPLLQQCQFNNCIHINEPNCAIKKAVAESSINESRYNSYCNMLESIKD